MPLTAALTLAGGVALSGGPGADERYWSLEEFRGVVALFPELRSPRPANLKREGYALWERGELRLPATPATLLEADFDGDGELDRAVLVETGADQRPKRHLLVIMSVSGVWRRGLLQALDARSAGDLLWDEGRRALGLDTGNAGVPPSRPAWSSRTASSPTRKRVSFSRSGWSGLLSGIRSRGDSSAGSPTGIGRRDAAPNSA